MIQIVKANAAHIDQILPILREADRQEIYAATGETNSRKELLKALKRDGKHFAAVLDDGTILALFGVAETNSFTKIGSPWLIASTAIEDHEIAFLKKSREFFPALIDGYDYLVNMVDARNTTSKKWLQWLGFRLYTAKPYGPFDKAFHKFDLCQIPEIQSISTSH